MSDQLNLSTLSLQQLQARKRAEPVHAAFPSTRSAPSHDRPQALREQLEVDSQKLVEHLQSLQAAVGRYHRSGLALEQLQGEKEGESFFPPMVAEPPPMPPSFWGV